MIVVLWILVGLMYVAGFLATAAALGIVGLITSGLGTDYTEAKKSERRLLWSFVWPFYWLVVVPYMAHAQRQKRQHS